MTRTKVYKRKGKLLLPPVVQPKAQLAIPDLTELPVQISQSEKALRALQKHVQSREKSNELIQTEEWYYLVIALIKMAPRERIMPLRLQVPFSYFHMPPIKLN